MKSFIRSQPTQLTFFRCPVKCLAKTLRMKFINATIAFLVTASFVRGFSLYKEEVQDDEVCKDERAECPEYAAKEGYCDYDFMEKYCRRSCGLCQPNPEAGPGGCSDEITGCARHAVIEGYCDYHADFMSIYCKKSCNFCDEVPPPKPAKETALKWSHGSWGPCKDGKQERYVRCYHEYKQRLYHVAFHYCKERIGAEEPIRERPCV